MTGIFSLALGSLIGSLIFAGICGRQMIRMRYLTRRLTAFNQQADEAVSLAEWAGHTILTVTRANGDIYGVSLADLHHSSAGGCTDVMWSDPICVSIWTGTPGTIARFRADLANLQETNPEDTTHG